MFSRTVKAGVFVLEGVNAVATTYYFYYIYFFMQERFGFGKLENLLLAAALGLIYMFAAMLGGKFAQRHGSFRALKLGFGILAGVLAAGSQIGPMAGHLVVMGIGVCGMCFTWPAFEAMVSEGEPPARLQRMVGIYNLIWAAAGGFAYFTGGAMLEHWGLRSMFLVPAALHLGQLALTFWLEKKSRAPFPPAPGDEPSAPDGIKIELNPRPIANAKTFLHMAWLANPFSYLAINSIIAVIPTLAKQMSLSPKFAGFFCSVWFFVRAGAFVLLWLWPGWHYRFRWLISAYAAMVAGFTAILLAPNLAVLITAQVVFGLALGLIYYSSLFYSMDVGETKAEHGGFHEAMIGAGSCAGPAIGVVGLYLFPQSPDSSTWAVSAMLLMGLAGLFWLHFKK